MIHTQAFEVALVKLKITPKDLWGDKTALTNILRCAARCVLLARISCVWMPGAARCVHARMHACMHACVATHTLACWCVCGVVHPPHPHTTTRIHTRAHSYHTVPGKALGAGDLKDGQQLTTWSKHQVTVKVDKVAGTLIQGASDTAKVLAADISAGKVRCGVECESVLAHRRSIPVCADCCAAICARVCCLHTHWAGNHPRHRHRAHPAGSTLGAAVGEALRPATRDLRGPPCMCTRTRLS
jgi:hypothetical protein